MIFFTSDHHFGHENIIEYCERPFASIAKMDEALIDAWNDKVQKASDVVYHLGDLTLGDLNDAVRYLAALNGNIKVLSNPWHHDGRWLYSSHYGPSNLHSRSGYAVELCPPMEVIRHKGKILVLCHYPILVWDRRHYGAWHLHGHSHGVHGKHGWSYEESYMAGRLDVGVDNHPDYAPFSFDEVEEILGGNNTN